MIHCVVCGKEFKVKPYRERSAKYCSSKCYGISKIGYPAWNKGVSNTWANTNGLTLGHENGTENHNYKNGKTIKNTLYRRIHRWIVKKLGLPSVCSFCKKDNLYGHKIHWANISHKYKKDIFDWIRLCVKCHINFDKKERLRIAL